MKGILRAAPPIILSVSKDAWPFNDMPADVAVTHPSTGSG